MVERASDRMTLEEFFRWQEEQDERYELVDGYPVKMMTGASNVHDAIVVNVITQLASQLRGAPCRVATPDTAVRTRSRSARRPDVTVYCGPLSRTSYEANEPKVLVEVLSKTNRGILWQRKLAEYQALETAAHIVLIDSQSIRAILFSRAGQVWQSTDIDGYSGVIELPAIACNLAMADIYGGIPEDEIRPEGDDP